MAALLALLEIGRELSAERDLDALLNRINRGVRRLLDAERSTLYLVDRESGEIISWKMEGNAYIEIRLPRGIGIAGIVAQTGETINIPDVYADARWAGQEYDRSLGYRTRSMLCMPLVNRQQEIIGAVQVINRRGRPFDADSEAMLAALCSFAAIALENSRLVESLRRAFDSFVQALTVAIDSRDRSTAGHSQRVTAYCLLLGAEMSLPDDTLDLLRQVATLHDVGKIGVPEAILKKPAQLTDEERTAMMRHVSESERILRNVEFTASLKAVPLCAGQHHERMDGHGYPCGLRGDEISLVARIVHVADAFDALTYRRYYHEPQPAALARAIIERDSGTDPDPLVVAAFQRAWPAIEAQYMAYQEGE
jgi:HD-GYP domain-containing protein (c-di-GMP phosphodiesterase class II)